MPLLHRSRVCRVLWRQDLSAYTPSGAAHAGLTHGRTLLSRYRGGPPSSSSSSSLRSSEALIKTRLHPSSQPQPSPCAPLICENVSDGVGFYELTPCSREDVAALGAALLHHTRSSRDTPPPVSSSRSYAAEGVTTVEVLLRVLRRYKALLAGTESIQTGIPLSASLESLDITEAFISGALLSIKEEQLKCSSSEGLEKKLVGDPSASTTCMPEVSSREGGLHTAVCVTPTYFSLAHAISATASLLLQLKDADTNSSDGSDDANIEWDDVLSRCAQQNNHHDCCRVVWMPSPHSFLSAVWFMQKLKDEVTQLEGLNTLDNFHVLLLGDRAAHMDAFVSSSTTTINTSTDIIDSNATTEMFQGTLLPSTSTSSTTTTPLLCFVGMTPAETADMQRDVAQKQRGSSTSPSAAISLWPSTPCVGFIPADGTSSEASHVAALADTIYTHCIARRPPSFFSSQRQAHSRMSLVMVPDVLLRPLLQHLVQHKLNGAAAPRMGHSLDPSTGLGPLTGAAHVQCALSTITAAAHGGWQQVCGGFKLPLTGAAAESHLLVPAVLCHSLSNYYHHKDHHTEDHHMATKNTTTTATTAGDAVRNLCTALKDLICPLEKGFGGTAGSVVFLCTYPTEAAADVRDGIRSFCIESGWHCKSII